MNHYDIKVGWVTARDGYSPGYLQKNLQFAKFHILQHFLELDFQPVQEDWTTLHQFIIPLYHYYDKASQKACSQVYLQKNLKFHILQILTETWFTSLGKNLVTLEVLLTLNRINTTPAILRKIHTCSLLKKVYTYVI